MKQEPVAWMSIGGFATCSKREADGWVKAGGKATPLYTHPQPQRTWVGLSEQERNDIENDCETIVGKPAFDAIEAKLKEKNT